MSFFSEIFQDLSKVPGSPEALVSALQGGSNGSLSWNPFSKSNSVWDTAAGGTQLSQNPTDRAIGRTVGSLFAGGALGGLLGGAGTSAGLSSDAGTGLGLGTSAGFVGGDVGTGVGLGTDAGFVGGDAGTGAGLGADAGGWTQAGSDAAIAADSAPINFSGPTTPSAGSPADVSNFTTPDPGYGSSSDVSAPTDAANPNAPTNPNAPDKSWLSKALGSLGNNKLQTAQLGLGTLGLINQVKQGSSAQKQMNAIAAPASQASQQLLAQFKAGTINPGDAYAIQQWQQTQQAQSDQYFAQAGLSNSSMHQQASSQIAAQAEAMRQQAVQNLLTQGLQAAGVANGTLVAGVNAGLQQDNAAMTTMQNFLATLAKMNTPAASGGGSSTQTQTGTPNG